MKHQKTNCKCIFCEAKCSNCNGTNIVVYFTPRFGIKNIKEQDLTIDFIDSKATVSCHDCKEFSFEFFDTPDGEPAEAGDRPTVKHDSPMLAKAVEKVLGFGSKATVRLKNNGEILSRHFGSFPVV